jgi:threonyl-tRNA synthetase
MKKAKENLSKMRHSCEHVLTQAMLKLYPGLLMAMGPAVEDGFYFDFDPRTIKISENDFPKIEEEMQKIIDQDLPIKRQILSIKKARSLFKGNPYKQEWLDEIEKLGKKATVYWTERDFVDLCSGPHVTSTGKIGPFKLLSIAGAYWRGDEKNKMLTRLYGTCFPSKEELDKYLWQLQEAKKRDHRLLGKRLDLFVINESIGKGLPLLTPKGNIIREEILKYEQSLENEAGFMRVSCPHIARTEIYKKTGHWQHYRELMYAPFGIDGEDYVLKPMNCPHHYMIYASRPRSYRDLPMRLAEDGTCYRFEKTGELSGLLRVRSLTIDDAHLLMTEEQVEDEFTLCINMVDKMFKAFHLQDYYVRLSLADPSDAAKYISDPKTWKKAGEKLEKIVKKNKLRFVVVKGEASFYGPKIDYLVKDSLGREWQMSTLQLDLFMAKRLNLTYTDKDGQEKHPIIIHRGLTGSLERTIGILIEHYGGAFPVWLSPIQTTIIPITDKHLSFGKKVFEQLKKADIRVELDDRSQTTSAKIRDAELNKIPYILVVGDREVKNNSVAVRERGKTKIKPFKLQKLIKEIREKIANKA